MTVTTKTTVGFDILKDNETLQKFVREFDLSEWKLTEVSGTVFYTKEQMFVCSQQ